MALRDQKFIRKVRFTVTNPVIPSSTNYDFEVDNVTVSMQRELRSFTKLNGDLVTRVRWVRPVFSFSNRYLRRAASGSYDITDVINALDDTSLQVSILLLDISTGTDAMSAVQVRSASPEVGTQIQRFKQIPTFNYTFQGVTALSAIPAWFKFTQPATQALL